MSMIGTFRLIAPGAHHGVDITELMDAEPRDDLVDVDKAWHGIHFLLCGVPGVGDDPASQAVLGGVEVGDDLGYGPCRHHAPEAVARIATALERIDRATLLARYDPAAMTREGIYPGIWDEDVSEVHEYLGTYYDGLRALYLRGREAGRAMLLWLE